MTQIRLGEICTYQAGAEANSPLTDVMAGLIGELASGQFITRPDALAWTTISVIGEPTQVDLTGFVGFIKDISRGQCSGTSESFVVGVDHPVALTLEHGDEHLAHRIVLDGIHQAIASGLFSATSFAVLGTVKPMEGGDDLIILAAESENSNMPIPAGLLALGLTRAVQTLNSSSLFGNT
jgi:hypothetical protein